MGKGGKKEEREGKRRRQRKSGKKEKLKKKKPSLERRKLFRVLVRQAWMVLVFRSYVGH